ncbi:phage protease [Stutzerimonas nitrititolerans]|uniref:phage protease n=1 Tax=Stutzerimonas nitrititolerans TaxID=2482751 RepID=UPI0028AF0D87|nr:phage protease [Stutzerimonas nitrititolerans]
MTRLIPAGTFDAPRGSLEGAGPWFLDEAAARPIIKRAAARSTDIVIDYEHQTLLSEQNGEPAPASGWIDRGSLEGREDGLYGRVDWKARAKAAIDADEYRYLSPVFPYDPKTGTVLDLLHVGLTNNPAIDTAIPALAAARMGSGAYDPTHEEDTVDREELIKLLGLAADATDEQITAAINGLIKAKADADQAIAAAKDESAQAVAAAKAGAKPDMSQYVPRAVYVEAQQQIAALSAGSSAAELDKLIEDGLKDGRIPGQATADWLKPQGIAACKAYLKGATPIAALRGSQTEGRKPTEEQEQGQGDDLSEAELAACKATGVAPADYRKSNPKQPKE